MIPVPMCRDKKTGKLRAPTVKCTFENGDWRRPRCSADPDCEVVMLDPITHLEAITVQYLCLLGGGYLALTTKNETVRSLALLAVSYGLTVTPPT